MLRPNGIIKNLLRVDAGGVFDEVDDLVGIAPLVVVPGDQLDELVGQHDARGSVEDRGVAVGDEVGGNDRILGVAQDALPLGGLGGLLHGRADVLIGGRGLEVDGQIDDGDVQRGHAEGHAGQLAVKIGNDLADGLGGTRRGGDDVARGRAAAAPMLLGGPVDGLLGRGGRVHGGHQAALDAVGVVNDLGERRQAVGRAGGVGDDLHVLRIGLVVDAHDEHRRVLAGSGDDDLLGAAVEVRGSALGGGEDAGRLGNVLGAAVRPVDVGRILLREDRDLVAVDDELAVLRADLARKAAVNRIVLQHVDHVIEIDEGIVDADDLNVLVFEGRAEDQTSDSAESVDTDFNHNTPPKKLFSFLCLPYYSNFGKN